MIEGKAIETFKGGNIGDTRIYIWCTTRVTIVFHPFKHRSAQKSKRPFIRSAPHVKEKVCIYICCTCVMLKPLFIVL